MPTPTDIQILTFIPRSWRDPILRASAAKALLSQPHHVLLGLGKNGTEGHLLASLVPGAPADVLTLFVPEAYRRRGHARALMRALLVKAKLAECQSLTLEVAASNTAAKALYGVFDLQQVSIRANYYHNPVSNLKEDALVLAVSLA
jgi:ribosomal protein S18 acetylase RimI-like enzyme